MADDSTKTIKGFFGFYWAVLKRAFSGKFARVERWTGALSIPALIFVAYTTPSPTDERTILTVLPAAFFVGTFILTVLIGLAIAPFQMLQEQRSARKLLEDQRKPKLKIALPDTGTVNVHLGGGTSESLAGTRQTVINAWLPDAVCLYCTNTGETLIRDCRARIIAVSRVSDDGCEAIHSELIEAIELPWSKTDQSCLKSDLQPNETKRVWIGNVRSQGHFWVFRQVNDLPIEAQQVFGPPGKYRIILQLDGDGIPPVQALLSIETGEGPKPKAGIHRGTAEIKIIETASPKLEGIDKK